MRKCLRWNDPLSAAESTDFAKDEALWYARQGGPQGWLIVELIVKDRFDALVNFEFSYEPRDVLGQPAPSELVPEDPRSVRYVRFVRNCRQALAFFQKADFLDIGVDRRENAWRKFLEAEAKCRETNQLFRLEQQGLFMWPLDVSGVFYTAQRKIAQVLGSCPPLGRLRFRYGPGATRLTPKSKASVRRKVTETLACSEDLVGAARHVIAEMPALLPIYSALDRVDEDGNEWSSVKVGIIPAKLNFVPKNAKTDRGIVTEAPLNVMVQLAYGDFLQRRLALFGLDTKDQSVNQERARIGSLTGALATLDLVSASDTLARELVASLLPPDWYSALARARSTLVVTPQGVLRQEKFSSMGNGYTFPLQTLIFWALAASCCTNGKDVTVYGDDIVAPTEATPLIRKVLNCAGFEVNSLKSYSSGPFRESCGKDYVLGIDIRPWYLRRCLTTEDLFTYHNFLYRRGMLDEAAKVDAKIHSDFKLYGPDGYGDGVLLTTGEYRKYRASPTYGGHFFKSYQHVPKVDNDLRGGDAELAYALYLADSSHEKSESFLPVSFSDITELSTDKVVFRSRWLRGMGPLGPRGLPVKEDENGDKTPSIPGTEEVKKIKIYKLGS